MDKTIVGAGAALAALGVGFATIGEMDYNLSSAFGTGGLLWLVIGSITVAFGLKVKRQKKQKEELRMGAI